MKLIDTNLTSLYLEMTPECKEFIRSNFEEFLTFGCGPGGLGDALIPDTIYNLSIKNA